MSEEPFTYEKQMEHLNTLCDLIRTEGYSEKRVARFRHQFIKRIVWPEFFGFYGLFRVLCVTPATFRSPLWRGIRDGYLEERGTSSMTEDFRKFREEGL